MPLPRLPLAGRSAAAGSPPQSPTAVLAPLFTHDAIVVLPVPPVPACPQGPAPDGRGLRMKQLALDIGLATGPTLGNYFAGANEAALQHLRLWVGQGSQQATRAPVPTFLWGAPGSGQSHLLKAVASALREQGASVGWLDPSMPARPEFDERWAAVLLDDVHLYSTAQQALAFNWFVNATSPGSGAPRWVLAAGSVPPADLPLRDDLRTRLGWGHR